MNILVMAPHPDDEVIGVGGTIAKRVAQGCKVYVCIVTRGHETMYPYEATEKTRMECRKADKRLGVEETLFLDFPAVMLETVPRYELNGKLCDLIQSFKPNEVYIPHRGDMQLDHQLVVDACMVALRPKYEHVVQRIYAYETLSETGWNIPNIVNEFIPTVFEDISDYMEAKLESIREFTSQFTEFPNARSEKAIVALAEYRGALAGVRAAEAFTLIREIKR